jgi:hypothetical protein
MEALEPASIGCRVLFKQRRPEPTSETIKWSLAMASN